MTFCIIYLKGPLSGMRQFLATESPLKVMKKSDGLTRRPRLFQNLRRHRLENK